MSPVKKGLHAEALGIKKFGDAPVDLLTNLIVAEVTVDPASLATVTGAVTDAITITGAALGDRVALFPPYDMQGVIAFGFVSDDDSVKISFFNPTGSTINLAEGDWLVQVIRP